MPRGARAVHGVEVGHNLHAITHRQADGTMVMPERHWLTVTCWCEYEIVGVPQREVVWGMTRSCGRLSCVNPETGERRPGHCVHGLDIVTARRLDEVGAPHHGMSSHMRSTTLNWQAGLIVGEAGQTTSRRKRHGDRTPAPAPRQVSRARRVRSLEGRGRDERGGRLRGLHRDVIAGSWATGRPVADIAAVLGIPVWMALDDLTWLQRQGRV